MKIPDIITDKINRLPLGYIFTYDDLNIQVDKIDAFIKALSRMVEEGRIRKLSPGKFINLVLLILVSLNLKYIRL